MFSISFYYLNKCKALYIMKLRGVLPPYPIFPIPYIGSEARCISACRASFRKISGIFFRKLTKHDIFNILTYIYLNSSSIFGAMNKILNINTMKRTNRTLKEETRQKISKALKGKPKTEQHKKALAEALKRYWNTVPLVTDNNINND